MVVEYCYNPHASIYDQCVCVTLLPHSLAHHYIYSPQHIVLPKKRKKNKCVPKIFAYMTVALQLFSLATIIAVNTEELGYNYPKI